MGYCGYLGGAEIFAPDAAVGSSCCGCCVLRRSPPARSRVDLRVPPSQHAIRLGLTPAPFEGAPVGQAPPSWGSRSQQSCPPTLPHEVGACPTVESACRRVLPSRTRRHLSPGASREIALGQGCCRRVPKGWWGESWRRRGCRSSESSDRRALVVVLHYNLSQKGKNAREIEQKKCIRTKVRNSNLLK